MEGGGDESFDFDAFNQGDYWGAVDQKVVSENISKVLYPNDAVSQGRELRLEQQHFFVSCSLQDMLRLHLLQGRSPDTFHRHFAVQLNDTHPAVAVAELMRLLIDEHGLPWERAWEVCRAALAYTNHTLLPEALERWPVPLFAHCCRAISRSSTRSTAASSRRCASAIPETTPAWLGCR